MINRLGIICFVYSKDSLSFVQFYSFVLLSLLNHMHAVLIQFFISTVIS